MRIRLPLVLGQWARQSTTRAAQSTRCCRRPLSIDTGAPATEDAADAEKVDVPQVDAGDALPQEAPALGAADTDRARESLQFMLDHQYYSMERLTAALRAFGRAREYEMYNGILALIESKPLYVTAATYDVMINVEASQGNYDRVVDLYAARKHIKGATQCDPCSALVSAIVLDAYGRLGRLEDMQQQFRKLAQEQQHATLTGLYNAVIKSFARHRRTGAAWRLFEEMDEKSVVRDKITYGIVMDVALQQGEWERAMELYTEMRERRTAADTFLCNMAIRACVGERSITAAESVLAYMKGQDIAADAFTYSYMIQCLVETKDIPRAQVMLKEMSDAGVQPIALTYRPFLVAYATAGKMEAVEDILALMADANVAMTSATGCYIIGALFSGGHIEHAQRFYDTLPERGVPLPDNRADNYLIRGYLMRGRPEQAERIFEGITDPDIMTCNSMLHGYIRNGQLFKADTLLKRLELPDNSAKPNIVTYNIMLEGAAGGRGDARLLELYLAKINAGGMRKTIVTYNAAIECYLKRNELDKAIEVSEEMTALGIQPNIKTHSHFLAHLTQTTRRPTAEHAEIVEAIFRDFLDRGLRPTTQLVNQLMKAARSIKNAEKAVELYGLLARFQLRPNQESVSQLLRACYDRNYVETGLTLIRSLQSDGFKMSLTNYELFFRLLAKGQRFDELLEGLAQLEQSGLKPRLATLQSITTPLHGMHARRDLAVKFEQYFRERFPDAFQA
ncbi:hypothetical protein RI367_003137 [Sorochytrium milnesiophthora]